MTRVGGKAASCGKKVGNWRRKKIHPQIAYSAVSCCCCCPCLSTLQFGIIRIIGIINIIGIMGIINKILPENGPPIFKWQVLPHHQRRHQRLRIVHCTTVLDWFLYAICRFTGHTAPPTWIPGSRNYRRLRAQASDWWDILLWTQHHQYRGSCIGGTL